MQILEKPSGSKYDPESSCVEKQSTRQILFSRTTVACWANQVRRRPRGAFSVGHRRDVHSGPICTSAAGVWWKDVIQRWWREILGPPAASRKIFGSADKLLTRCHLQCSLAPLVQIGAQSDKSEPWTS